MSYVDGCVEKINRGMYCVKGFDAFMEKYQDLKNFKGLIVRNLTVYLGYILIDCKWGVNVTWSLRYIFY